MPLSVLRWNVAFALCLPLFWGTANPCLAAGFEQTELTTGWRLKQCEPAPRLASALLDEAARPSVPDGWLEIAQMPAMVHSVLLDHGLIETPWKAFGAEQCRWVAEKDWVYAVRFKAKRSARRQFLHFKGLDTIVDVYLNGQRIARHSDMYLPLRVDATEHLRDENTLALHFRTVFQSSDGKSLPLRYVDDDPERPVRRPQQNYGRYLGPNPCFSRVGVFDKVLLEDVPAAEIQKCLVDAAVSEDLRKGTVSVRAQGFSDGGKTVLKALLIAPDGSLVRAGEAAVAAAAGPFEADVSLTIDDPQLWWPRGYGEQPLYQVVAALVSGGQELQRVGRNVGFRRVEMPRLLHFKINGAGVRLWGGNWVSPDWLSMVWNPRRAERLFEMAENAHMNALRVWGESEPPPDEFYQLADRRGFMIWQDFHGPHPTQDLSSQEAFLEDARHLIERVKHHPSILLWCGGNESAMWHDFNRGDEPFPVRRFFEKDLKEFCRELDPGRYCHPNSPYYGHDANDPKAGDTHGYTNIWHVPGYDYLNFASEDTRIAAPPLHSIRRFFAPEDVWPEDYSPLCVHGKKAPWPESWMRYTSSESWKKTGPLEQFYDATSPAELVYQLGMAESVYYRDTIERQRRGRPPEDGSGDRSCGGYLVWKYNDSWPQVYSAKVDYFLEPYIPYYAIRRAFSPVLLSFEIGSHIWLWVVNDAQEPVEGEISIRLFHLGENAVKREIRCRASVGPDQSRVVARLDEFGTFRKEHILYAVMTDGAGRVLARTNALVDIERRTIFPDARLDVRVVAGELVIRTDKFARSVVLEGDAGGDPFGWFFEDNYFDLLPGEVKTVRVLGDHARGRVTAKPWYSPHRTEVGYSR